MADTIVRLRVDSKEYDAQIKEAAEGLLHLEKSLRDEGKTLTDVDKEQLKYIQTIGQMKTKSTTAQGKVNELSKAYIDLAMQYKNMSDEVKRSDAGKAMAASMEQVKLRAQQAKTQLAAVNAELAGSAAMKGGLGVSLSAGVGSVLSMFGPQMMAIAGVTAAIAGIKSTLSDVVNINKQFEQSSANLAAVMGTTRDQITDLTAQAKQLGATTQYTAMQITDLQTNLARLGFSQQEILNSTKAVQALATATGADLGEAANLAGAALRGFGMNAAEMDRVASVLAVSTTKSALSFEKLAAGLPTVAPVAKQFGFTIEDTVTLLGKLSDAGMDASTAATSTRNILLNLANSGGKLAQALGRPVRSIEELAPALVELKAKGLDLAEMLNLTDKRSVAAFATFVDNAETLTEFKRSITDCSDALDGMVNEQLNTLQGSVTILKSAYEGLLLTFSNGNGILKQTTDALARLLQAWTNWRNRRQGGDAAIGSYEEGLTPEREQSAKETYRAMKEMYATDQDIQKMADNTVKSLTKERDTAKELYDQLKKIDQLKGREHDAAQQTWNEDFRRMFPDYNVRENGAAPTYLARRIAGMNDQIAEYNHIAALATPAVAQNSEEEGDANAEAAKKLRTIEAQYKEQEVAQIAALDRQAMNEEEYEKKVYEIKRTWLQKIADLYEEGTEQRARANASISSLDIQYQGSVTRRANQQARAEERAAAKEKTAPFLYGDAGMANMASEIKKEMSTQIVGSEGYLINAERIVDLTTFQNLLKTATAAGIQLDPALVVGAIDRIGLGIDIPDKEWNALVETINAHLKTLGIDPIELNVSTGAVKTAETEAKTLEFGWVKAAQAVEQVGSAIQSIEDPSAKIAGIIASAIANVAAGLGGILASQEAMANPWNWVALALSGTATMISTVSAIKSATAGSYAQGGRIEGNSYSGDNMRGILPNGELIGLDAGEIVLNHAQQTNVARDLQGGGISNLKLEALISGRDLRLVLANNDRFFGGSRGDYVVATSRS